MKLILCFLALVGCLFSQVLPDNPGTVQPPAPAVRPGFWRPWTYPNVPNHDVFHNWAYRTYVLADLSAIIFDQEMSKEGEAHQDHKLHRYCVEGNTEAGPLPSRWDLYRTAIPEFTAVTLFGYIATKVKMPSWVLFSTEAYSIQVHVRGGLGWYESCW